MIRFPILEAIAKFFEGKHPLYILWFATVALCGGLGALAWKDGVQYGNYVFAFGMTVWLGGLIYVLVFKRQETKNESTKRSTK